MSSFFDNFCTKSLRVFMDIQQRKSKEKRRC
nr:MAG TPA: PHB accumulation regulatory domain [Caudoviricetes sp.]